jgi:hypothetical protein
LKPNHRLHQMLKCVVLPNSSKLRQFFFAMNLHPTQFVEELKSGNYAFLGLVHGYEVLCDSERHHQLCYSDHSVEQHTSEFVIYKLAHVIYIYLKQLRVRKQVFYCYPSHAACFRVLCMLHALPMSLFQCHSGSRC